MKNIVILISGGGSNMASIVRAAQRESWETRLQARVAAVISNRPQAGGLAIARDMGISTEVLDHRAFPDRSAFDAALAERIDHYDPQGKPALVPAFTGLHTHQRALDAGCRVAGATVHMVTAQLDEGPILAQAVVPVLEGDTAQTLAARVVTQEHVMYPRAIASLLRQ